jgi:hypothetical protein
MKKDKFVNKKLVFIHGGKDFIAILLYIKK